MKTHFLKLSIVAFIVMAMASCKNKENEAETSDAREVAEAPVTAESFSVDTHASVIHWKGSKPTGTHMGTVNIAEGTVMVKDGNVEAGKFTIDMKTITDTDLEGDMKSNLEAHLKGTAEGKEGDFFNVNEYPTASFELTGIKQMEGKTMVEGNLTMKGTANHISFPATVTHTGNAVKIESETFSIDRTKWGVNYGSKSVFDNLGDKFIDDAIELTISVTAQKS